MKKDLLPMKSTWFLALLPLSLTAGCALETAHDRIDDGALIETQVSPDQVATCIAQRAGTTAVPDANGGFTVDVAAPSGTTRLTITRDKVQTIVVGPQDGQVPDAVGKLAIDCVLKLTPPAQ